MKKTSKFYALLLVFLLMFVLPTVVFADENNMQYLQAGQQNDVDDNDDLDEEDAEENGDELDEDDADEADEDEDEDADDDRDGQRHIGLKFKDKDIESDVPPVIKNGRVLVPLRAMAAVTGADVSYKDGIVTLVKGDITIYIEIGSNVVSINGEPLLMDVQAELMDNRTMVPIRFVVENLRMNAQWNPQARSVEIDENEDDDNDADDDGDDEDEDEDEDGQDLEGILQKVGDDYIIVKIDGEDKTFDVTEKVKIEIDGDEDDADEDEVDEADEDDDEDEIDEDDDEDEIDEDDDEDEIDEDDDEDEIDEDDDEDEIDEDEDEDEVDEVEDEDDEDSEFVLADLKSYVGMEIEFEVVNGLVQDIEVQND